MQKILKASYQEAAKYGHARLMIENLPRLFALVEAEETNLSGTEFTFEALRIFSEIAQKHLGTKNITLELV